MVEISRIFPLAVRIRLAVLDVDHAGELVPAQNRHGQKRLKPVFGQFMDNLKTRIARRIAGDRHRFPVFGDPSGDSLTHADFQPVYNFLVRVL